MPRTVCPTCREEIDPDDPDAVIAAEVVRTAAFRVGGEEHERVRVIFYERCFPEGSPDYRRVPPEADA